jgi:aspartate kinase
MTRPIIVQKYGGSSVSDITKIKRVAEKIVATHRAGNSVVAIVSAMGDTTDELIKLARQASANPDRRELDMLLSVGERISMALLSIAIEELGEDAISLTGSQAGILTTDSHSNARIIDVRPFRVQDELERGRIVIVAGFQGTSYRREITTLGRGGSDTTAVALAASLSAIACDIYSDVDGIFSADPRVVPAARKLEDISWEEMQELARQGARVLNAQAVEFARRKQIAIYARSTFGGGTGTAIHRVDGFPDEELREHRALGVRGVATAKDRLLFSLEGNGQGNSRELDFLRALGDTEVIAFVSNNGSGRLDVLVSVENVHDPEGLVARLQRDFSEAITVHRSLGTVAAVGLGVGGRPAAVLHARMALNDAQIPVTATFTTNESVCLAVPLSQTDAATRCLHAAFIENPPGKPAESVQNYG